MDYQPGDIIRGDFLDPQGENLKNRPALVIQKSADGMVCLVLPTTTQVDGKDPWTAIELPYSNPGNPRTHTGLTERCVVLCTWPELIAEADVTDKIGTLKTIQVAAITNRFKEVLKQHPELREKLQRQLTQAQASETR